jgi:4-diphosphocytidyl-2-C-methyl-D-erythritol kinase
VSTHLETHSSDHHAKAHAKVNLALAVTGVRDDGYHQLRSVFLRLALHDDLGAEMDPAAAGDSLVLEGASVPLEDNHILRAAHALRAAIDPGLPPLRFRLRKRIPVAAGLGGGSSDAAAAIDLALAAWGMGLDPERRHELAAGLGADVPFFASDHAAALVEGIGEHVLPLPPPQPAAGILLVTLPAGLSTAAVFAEHDRGPAVGDPGDPGAAGHVDLVAALLRASSGGSMVAAAAEGMAAANDLWPAAARLSPGLSAARDAASRILGRTLLLTGSGPTLVAVYPAAGDAMHAATALPAAAAAELAGATILATSTMPTGAET